MIEEDLYDIYGTHGSWNATALRKILGPSTPLFTVVRDPSTAFESIYGYYGFKAKTNLSFGEYVERLGEGKRKPVSRKGMTLNNMSRDFGLKMKNRDMGALGEKLKALDTEFDLVMVMEMMDESLVLLAHLLCLPLHFMVSLKKNARTEGKREEVTDHQREVLKGFQYADEVMYSYFRKRLLEQIEEFGRKRMESSVLELQRLRSEVEAACEVTQVDNSEVEGTMIHTDKGRVNVFTVNEDILECSLMTYSEPNLINMVKKQQNDRLNRVWEQQGKKE